MQWHQKYPEAFTSFPVIHYVKKNLHINEHYGSIVWGYEGLM